jgi:adenosylcobyric acid synthase
MNATGRPIAPVLHVLSPSAAGGKTVWSVGLIRALVRRGVKVVPFKPIGEGSIADGDSHRLCVSALHMVAAAELEPRDDQNPVVVRPTGQDRADIWLQGERVGNVRLFGRDMPILDDLGPDLSGTVRGAVFAALARCRTRGDLVLSEGAGSATDLSELGCSDVANLGVGAIADAAVLVARASRGGALVALEGTLRRLPPKVVSKVRGLVLNDIRVLGAELGDALAKIADRAGLEVLSLLPWLPFFDGRPGHLPFSPESRDDHDELGRAVAESLRWRCLAAWLGIAVSEKEA